MQQMKTETSQKTANKRFIVKVNEGNRNKKLHKTSTNSIKKSMKNAFKSKKTEFKYDAPKEKNLNKMIQLFKKEIEFAFKKIPEYRKPCIIIRNRSNMEKMDKGLVSLTTEIFNTTIENPNVPNGKPITSVSLYWIEKQTLSAAIIVNNNVNNFVFQGSGKGEDFVTKVIKYFVRYLENTVKGLKFNSTAVGTIKSENVGKK